MRNLFVSCTIASLRRRRAIAGAALLVIVASAGPLGAPQTADSKDTRPIVPLGDAFEYALRDFGVGSVPESLFERPRHSKRFLWVKVQLRNRAADQLARPKYWPTFSRYSVVSPTGEFGKTYPTQTRTLRAPRASDGRYQPGESSIELILIPADELLDPIKELHIALQDPGPFGGPYLSFVLHHPLTRGRDFDPERADPDLADVPASFRRSPMGPERRK